ncbi:DUF4179 domain-containing protein [Lysinibacillus sp. NPDC056959]|uniref:DUF4179 domain-containing protein n=1 Tax=Lysinibacillus sp. NPDC056959 TaxID=3345981 RepID=UPI00362DA852
MESNIKEAINNIDVPLEKLDQAIEKGMRSEMKKSKKGWRTAIVSVVASVVLILGSGFISPQMANVLADMPLIGFMYNIVEQDEGLQTALSDDNKVKLNKTVTSNGIAITVEEIVYDGARLNVIFSMPKYMDIAPGFLYVNGRELNTGESLRVLEDQDGFRGLWEFPIDEELPDEFDLTLKFLQVGSTKGEWVFSTPIKKVKNDSHKLVAGQSGKVNGISFDVESVEASATSTKIKVKFDATSDKLFSEEAGVLNATIMDQNGAPLKVLHQSGSGGDKSTTYTYLTEPLNKNITDIKIAYYFSSFDMERKDLIVPLADTLPQRISQGEMGDLVITEVTNKGQKATLSFYVDSDFPYNNNLISLDVKSESGESLIIEYAHAIGPNKFLVSYQTNVGKPIIHILETPYMEVETSANVTIPVK